MLNSPEGIPLPERLRPKTIDDFVGQEHLVGKGSILRKMLESGDPRGRHPLALRFRTWQARCT